MEFWWITFVGRGASAQIDNSSCHVTLENQLYSKIVVNYIYIYNYIAFGGEGCAARIKSRAMH